MAQRRMFSPDIVTSDAFLEMPPSTQALYFQFGMRADDDGFVNPRMVMRMMGSTDDELKVLIAKRFILPFENGVIVIKHWRINNLVRKDWYRPTIYTEQKNQLYIKENGCYTDNKENGVPMNETIRQRTVNEPSTQVRLGKVRLVKDSKKKESTPTQDIVILKDTHGELGNVKLSKEELEKLVATLGKYDTESQITNLDLYIAKNGKDKYKSHYATILSWSRNDQKKRSDNSKKVYGG